MAYTSKGKVVEISAVSRTAVKIRDNYYTIESSEKKSFDANLDGIDMEKEWSILFDEINDVVDKQIEDTVRAVTQRK